MRKTSGFRTFLDPKAANRVRTRSQQVAKAPWIGQGMITQEQHDELLADASSLTHEGVVALLRRSGLEGIAARLDYLRQVVDEDPEHPPMSIESLRSLAKFLVAERQLPHPQISVGPDGLLSAQWRTTSNDVMAMEFLGSGLIRFAALSSPGDPEDPWSVSGTLPRNEVMTAVEPFTVRMQRR